MRALTSGAGMIKKHNNAFGKVLRKLRTEKNISQEYLGFEADLTRAYISLLERGLRSPTIDTQIALCGPLRVSLTALSALIEADLSDQYE